MSVIVCKGRYRARLAGTAADVTAAQALRHLCFVERAGGVPRPGGLDADAFDAACLHVLVEETVSGRLVACFRLLPLSGGAEIGRSYAAQHYELSSLEGMKGPMLELGRFCIHPEACNADVLRIAWGALTRYVDDHGVTMLFGCSSFPGTEEGAYLEAFDLLSARHIAPARWRPRVKAPNVVRFAERFRRGGGGLEGAVDGAMDGVVDGARGMLRMPPLLKTYLAMGGWVSDHAVVDRDLNTLHVFTGLEIAAIPPARVKALRAVAG